MLTSESYPDPELLSASPVEDKTIKVFPGAAHNLFMELPEVKKQVFDDVIRWIERRR